MKLFFDTETTGLPLLRAPHTDAGQPHIVQLGAILCDDERRVVGEMNLIVRPSGWVVPEEAARVHGITTDRALHCGLPLPIVMATFAHLSELADELIAHNFPFDDLMIRSAWNRLRSPESAYSHSQRKSFCTMRAATSVLKLPGKYGDYKWPNLQEAHTHFTGKPFDGAHDAMADVRACMAVYYALHREPTDLALDVP